MRSRTDLAIDEHERVSGSIPGVKKEELSFENVRITRITVENAEGAEAIGKPVGRYITVETESFGRFSDMTDARQAAVTGELSRLLPPDGAVLVAGLGNTEITPDAVGPRSVGMILATRHLSGELTRKVGLGDLRAVSALSPGVLGKTGIETGELLFGVVRQIAPAAVIVIDALASNSLSRLGRTVQITDTGIIPGSGVGNARREISRNTLGVPVIAVGVPTVVDAVTLARDVFKGDEECLQDGTADMMVTPREIDTVVENAAALIALSVNRSLHPAIPAEELMALVG